MLFSLTGDTHKGNVRTSNQDYYLIDASIGLAVICDGVGGSAGGEVASQIAAETARSVIVDGLPRVKDAKQISGLLHRAVASANEIVLERSSKESDHPHMATTMDIVLCRDGMVHIAHVGDGSVFLIRKGKSHRLTHPHNANYELKKQGWSDEAIRKSAYFNTLTRAIGAKDFVSPDFLKFETAKGDRLLMCTDGLTDYLEESSPEILFTGGSFAEAPKRFIDYALQLGGKDNITVITIETSGERKDRSEVTGVDALKKGEVLGAVSLFRHLEYTELLEMLEIMRVYEVEAGETLLKEGEPSDHMIITIKGEVEVLKGNNVISRIGSGTHVPGSGGEVFGEMGLFDAAPRSASVRTTEPTTIMEVKRQDLMALMKKNPSLAVKLLWALTQELNAKLRATTTTLSDLQTKILPDETTDVDLPFTIEE